jgi:hypothetical protein
MGSEDMNPAFATPRTRDDDDQGHHPNAWHEYRRRVRNTVYLWGSAGLTEDMTFTRPPILHIHNDLFGEEITVSTSKANGTTHSLGTLDAGQCISVAIDKMCGVFASCTKESTVMCRLR